MVKKLKKTTLTRIYLYINGIQKFNPHLNPHWTPYWTPYLSDENQWFSVIMSNRKEKVGLSSRLCGQTTVKFAGKNMSCIFNWLSKRKILSALQIGEWLKTTLSGTSHPKKFITMLFLEVSTPTNQLMLNKIQHTQVLWIAVPGWTKQLASCWGAQQTILSFTLYISPPSTHCIMWIWNKKDTGFSVGISVGSSVG